MELFLNGTLINGGRMIYQNNYNRKPTELDKKIDEWVPKILFTIGGALIGALGAYCASSVKEDQLRSTMTPSDYGRGLRQLRND